jgi:hypothetical protein
VEVFEMAGIEGLSHHEKETNKLYKDQEMEKMIEILLNTCTHPLVIGSSEHFLIICRKNLQYQNSI